MMQQIIFPLVYW